jgi:hypothetical protein
MPEIKNISIKHDAIMDFLMANPAMKLGDVATHFQVTQPWLSCIIHSDIFQARLKEKSDVAFHSTVLPLREKMIGVAHMALDKLADVLPKETETKVIASTAEGLLDRLGFGSKQSPMQPGTNVNLQVNVLRSELDEARALLGKAQKPMLEVTIDGERSGIALPLRSEASVGSSNSGEGSTIPALRSERELSKEGSET